MCGICGIVGFEDKALLKKMCDIMHHRGPDDSGMFLDKDIGLGHRRLSIIDLKKGHQPIHNEDESIWVIYNGEIYNYEKLKQELEGKRHRFYTDTEVIIHLYEEDGEDCVKKLRGMFAFAIWDSDEQKLLLARDRLGIKPLYYTIINGKLLFASEIKSILQYNRVLRRVNHVALHNYLTFRYVPGPETMFEGIKKLLPAHIMTYKEGKIAFRKYWDLEISAQPTRPERYYIEHLLELLKETVKIRLMADVPLGVYLSGGIDSSGVLALMSEMVDEPIKTISIGFGEYDPVKELNYARVVADRFDTEHHEIVGEPDCIKLLPKIIWHLDEPVADATTIPTYLISEFAKKHLTVALTGDGGDEMFGGYVQYKIIQLSERYNKLIPDFIKFKLMVNLIKTTPISLLDKFFEYPFSIGEKGKERLIEYLFSLGKKGESYLTFISLFSEKDKKELYSKNLLNATENYGLFEDANKLYFNDANPKNILDLISLREFKTWLPDYILTRLDKMTMANAIEGRVPFLDHKLAEFSITIPQHLKSKGGIEKYIFRKTMSKLLPRDIRRRKKYPFFIPIDAWFEGNVKELVSQVLSRSVIEKRDYFKHDYIQRILRDHHRSKLIYSRQLWALLTFELWHKIYIDNADMRRPALDIDSLC